MYSCQRDKSCAETSEPQKVRSSICVHLCSCARLRHILLHQQEPPSLLESAVPRGLRLQSGLIQKSSTQRRRGPLCNAPILIQTGIAAFSLFCKRRFGPHARGTLHTHLFTNRACLRAIKHQTRLTRKILEVPQCLPILLV